MEKFLLDMLQIIILVKVGYSLIKWMFRSKKRSKSSIVTKVWRLLVANKIHHYLDNALKKQKEVLHPTKQKVAPQPSNVIPLRKTK